MGRLVTLEELEAYRQDVYHADREGRPPRYRDPREVFNEDPNREEGFLVELTEDEVLELIKYREEIQKQNEANKEQVIQEIMENGNVPAGDAVLPVHQEQGEADTGAYLTREQATALYDANALHTDSDVNALPPVGALNNPAQSPSIAPEESVVPVPGSVEGAPEPMQSIVEAAALQGNTTGSVHQNLVSTPNPGPLTTTEDVPAETTDATVTPATGGDNPTTAADLKSPDLNEPSSVPSPTAPEAVATQTQEQQTANTPNQTVDPGTQQFQPVAGENAGPTVPGADTIQTPTLNDEAAVPSEPTNADAVTTTTNPPADNTGATGGPSFNATPETPASTTPTDTQANNAPPTSE